MLVNAIQIGLFATKTFSREPIENHEQYQEQQYQEQQYQEQQYQEQQYQEQQYQEQASAPA
uniref:Uncharacterized protein n=1 Tax=Bionectria ochroleuca TaxID=29856 RepID=A0A8H7K2Q8_BIOOC